MVSFRDSHNALSERTELSADPEPAAEQLPASFIAQWPRQTILRLSGPDAGKFLQGQLTCQLDELTESTALYGAACTPKGKALASFRLVLLENGDILLRLATDLAEQIQQHFKKYLAFFKAKLEPADGWAMLGICGAEAHQALGLATDLAANGVVTWNRSRVVASQPEARGLPRSELWLNVNDTAQLEDAFSTAGKGSLPAAQGDWLATEIQAGLTTIDQALSDRLVPQYFNWHSLGGISFQKGCYTGQEIIARLRYLGQLKKSTYRVRLPEGGATVLSAISTEDGRQAGEITNLVTYGDGAQEALAVINHQAATGRLYTGVENQHPVVIAPLPYQVEEQQAASENPGG